MSYIRVTVDEQTLHITDSPKIAAQGVNENYIVFDFDATWSGFSKVALFYREGDESQVYKTLIVNNEAVVPHEVTDQEGKICFGICGVKDDKVYTSEILKYKIVKGLYTSGQESEPPTPGIYEQMLLALDVMQSQVNNLIQNYNVEYGSKTLWEGELYWAGSSVVPWEDADLTRTLSDNVYDYDYVDIYLAINSSTQGVIGRFLFTLPKVEADLLYPILFSYGSKLSGLESGNHNLNACRFTVKFPTSTTINLYEAAVWLWNGSVADDATINRLGGHGFCITKVVGRKIVANAEVTDIRIGADGTVYESAGEAVRSQISMNSRNALPDEVKTALLNLFSHVAYADENGQTYYDALNTALNPPVNLVSISAVFDQGNNVICDSDSLDTLRQYLTVTARYSDLTTETISGYTLSGTLTEGISAITVSYGGKTTVFNVTVTESPASGYITDGLVFFLDGKSVESNSQWIDKIGGKSFTLTDCTATDNGVVFNGSTSYGEYDGAVTSDYANETIEVVFTAADLPNIVSRSFLYQPTVDGKLGISMYFGFKGGSRPRFALIADGGFHDLYNLILTEDSNRIGGNVDFIVANENKVSDFDNTDYPANETGKTYVGARKTTATGSFNSLFNGTIHAIRIYNRKLTEAEVKANQQRDAAYYGV